MMKQRKKGRAGASGMRRQREARASAARRAATPPRKKGPSGRTRRRVRLDPATREKMILDAAVHFFAEHGFEAQLSELSARLGVSQGLIFRYFGNKQTLIERVYQQVYVARWLPDWERLLRDRSRPLEARLFDFCRSYLAAVDDYVWVRTALYSGLSGNDLTRRYIITRVENLLAIIAEELLAAAAETTPQMREHIHEMTWHLHSTFIYYLIRKYVYNVPVTNDRDGFVAAVVQHFMAPFRRPERLAEPPAARGAARHEPTGSAL